MLHAGSIVSLDGLATFQPAKEFPWLTRTLSFKGNIAPKQVDILIRQN